MYEDIREQIKIRIEENQQILVLGDLNTQIDAAIEDNNA